MKKLKYEIVKELLEKNYLIVDTENGEVYRTRMGGGRFYKYPKKIGTKDRAGYFASMLTLKNKKTTVFIHHIIWVSKNGEIPEGLQIDHKNNIKSDNRISNLNLLTQGDNIRKSLNYRKLPLGEDHKLSKLKEPQVRKIRELYKTRKYMKVSLAKMFNVTDVLIGNIVRREIWKHLAN